MTSVSMFLHDRSNEEIVRPRVPLEACLASFSGEDEIPDFYSTALNSKTTAIKYVYLEICISNCKRFHQSSNFITVVVF